MRTWQERYVKDPEIKAVHITSKRLFLIILHITQKLKNLDGKMENYGKLFLGVTRSDKKTPCNGKYSNINTFNERPSKKSLSYKRNSSSLRCKL